MRRFVGNQADLHYSACSPGFSGLVPAHQSASAPALLLFGSLASANLQFAFFNFQFSIRNGFDFHIRKSNKTTNPPTIPPACDTATRLPNNPKSKNPKNILPVIASNAPFPTTRTKQIHPILRSVLSLPNISIAEIAIDPCATPDKPHSPFANVPGDAIHDAAKLPAAVANT